MKTITLIVACIILLSCKKDKASDSTFQSCNIEASKTQQLNNQSGTLSYTNKIGILNTPNFHYIIRVTGQLPLEVCNMPTSLALNENETKNILFSGKMVVLSDKTDAVSTPIELSKLKFN